MSNAAAFLLSYVLSVSPFIKLGENKLVSIFLFYQVTEKKALYLGSRRLFFFFRKKKSASSSSGIVFPGKLQRDKLLSLFLSKINQYIYTIVIDDALNKFLNVFYNIVYKPIMFILKQFSG